MSTASIREQIVVAMVAALNTNKPSGIPTCGRYSGQHESYATLPGMHLVGGAQTTKTPSPSSPILTHTTEVKVEISVAGAGTDVETVADAIYTYVVTRLVRNTLGGLVHWINLKGYDPNVSQEDRPYADFTITLEVEYQTNALDPTKTC